MMISLERMMPRPPLKTAAFESRCTQMRGTRDKPNMFCFGYCMHFKRCVRVVMVEFSASNCTDLSVFLLILN